jgi:hypothetical protein
MKKGNQQYYTVNRDFSTSRRSCLTEGFARVIKKNLLTWERSTSCLSMDRLLPERPEQKMMSNLFIVGDENRLIPLVHESGLAVNCEINYTLMQCNELEKRKRTGDPFVKNVMQETRRL